jgi:hypothetical protein
MVEAEKKRQSVSADEIEETRSRLSQARVPAPRNPKESDEKQDALFACVRCGHQWQGYYSANMERPAPSAAPTACAGSSRRNRGRRGDHERGARAEPWRHCLPASGNPRAPGGALRARGTAVRPTAGQRED